MAPAAAVLKRFFGTDHIAFTTCSLTLPAGQTCTDASPVLRSYASFSQAAEENGVSRILVGFHFRKAVDEGIEHGAGSPTGRSTGSCARALSGSHPSSEAPRTGASLGPGAPGGSRPIDSAAATTRPGLAPNVGPAPC